MYGNVVLAQGSKCCLTFDQKAVNYNAQMRESSFLTSRFNVAFEFAFALHHSQTRKGTPVPYIGHLMAVCSLVLDAGGDEDQAISALLHDAVEDQGGLATLETIRRLFGSRVADAVESCSDSMASDPAQKLPWRERKEKYLAHLRDANADALMVEMKLPAVAPDQHGFGHTLAMLALKRDKECLFRDELV